MHRPLWHFAIGLSVTLVVWASTEQVAHACGCLSPPLPPPIGESDYAVNQRAEQIIFEVEPNVVTAHVLIKYAGAPESFAWIIPVPEAPSELGISPVSTFAMIDQVTAPDVSIQLDDACPVSEWECRFKNTSCGGFGGDLGDPTPSVDGGFASDAGGTGEPPVHVIDEQVVGDFETVTFTASQAGAATQWLRDNGFIVNSTTAIYMEPYVQANMVFVAIKLVPGAGISAIKPLKITYRSAFPMIPLVLTAVAAEPHLTVSAFIYSDQPFRPMGHPIVSIPADQLARDAGGRGNYPMLLARTIDEAGGDAFAMEYRGPSPRPVFGGGTGCCGAGFDVCGIGFDGQCECPGDEFDQADCAAVGDVVEGAALASALADRHSTLTRLTTRISPEEMQFDPTFEPELGGSQPGRLQLRGKQASLDNCTGQVLDKDRLAEIQGIAGCASMYCGQGQCVATAAGPACACDAGFVAQRFLDLDGAPSVTCVPETPTVDLRANGESLPDACANRSCGMGECRDRNGVAVCECDGGAAAVIGTALPRCEAIAQLSGTPGAQNYSEGLRDLAVCAPAAPSCGDNGWVVRVASPRVGVDCGNSMPSVYDLIEPKDPDCGLFGCGGCQSQDAAPLTGLGLVGFVLLIRRRRGRR